MYPEEHYQFKIRRNAAVLDKAPELVKQNCLQNIIWARELTQRLGVLDMKARDEAIKKINKTMDEDYKKMGFELEEVNTRTK